MLKFVKKIARSVVDEASLPKLARDVRRGDRQGSPGRDPGSDAVITSAIEWLRAAQDNSSSKDGGIARHFSLLTGWAPSYPETSGYIIPTLIESAARDGRSDLRTRARSVLDWLVSIQFAEGGFQGGVIGASPVVPVTFNTGQILLGLAAGCTEWGNAYSDSMHRAATWLVDTIDSDGCWRKFPTPFATYGEKAYETHVSWGLVEAARASGDPTRAAEYAATALRNCQWALSHQHGNGWFDRCSLESPASPLTHTLGYVLRGLVEVHLYTKDAALLDGAMRTGLALAQKVRADGFLAGRLDKNWKDCASWACLTGSAQIAHALLLLFRESGEPVLRDAARSLLSYVRRTVKLDGPVGIRGGVQGSFPVDGDYGRYEYLNWAAKFLIDACRAERTILSLT